LSRTRFIACQSSSLSKVGSGRGSPIRRYFQMSIIPKAQVIVAHLVLDAGSVDAGPTARVRQHDDEGI
jgi:hypothetical protein